MKKILVVTSIFLMIFVCHPQDTSKAAKILDISQNTVYLSVRREQIKSVYIKSVGKVFTESVTVFDKEQQPRTTKIVQDMEENLSIEFDDKIRQMTTAFLPDKNPNENNTIVESVLNGNKIYVNTDTISDGKRVDLNTIFNSPFMSESMKKQMKELQEKSKPTKETFQKSIYTKLFPVFLDMNWMKDKTFVYIGKAEAGDKRADILEIETDTGRQTRYFFDEKTHFLLMITDEISKDGRSSKTTTYFDDYQLFDGLLVAKKVNTESENSAENVEMEIMGKKMKISIKTKMVSENIIKEFKINPTFKPDTFAVKEKQ